MGGRGEREAKKGEENTNIQILHLQILLLVLQLASLLLPSSFLLILELANLFTSRVGHARIHREGVGPNRASRVRESSRAKSRRKQTS